MRNTHMYTYVVITGGRPPPTRIGYWQSHFLLPHIVYIRKPTPQSREREREREREVSSYLNAMILKIGLLYFDC